VVGQPSGPRRTRTVFVLLAGEVHCHSCVGPMSPRGRSRTCHAKAPGLRPGAVPRRRPAEGIDEVRANGTVAAVDPIAGDLFNCQGAFGRDEPGHLTK